MAFCRAGSRGSTVIKTLMGAASISLRLTTLLAEVVYFLHSDAEAMRIAVIVGKEKLGLPVVSMYEF